jgi:hypothetical protein
LNNFIQNLQDWQLFFSTVATASAALTGLLFVSLSLNRSKLKHADEQINLAKARLTFSDFLYVLMISFVFLVPHQVPYSLTIALVVLGLTRAIGMVRDLIKHPRYGKRGTGKILRDVFFPLLASCGLIFVGIEVYLGINNSIYWLVGVIATLLISACWNAWLLLVEI